jgi:hypothetical protein
MDYFASIQVRCLFNPQNGESVKACLLRQIELLHDVINGRTDVNGIIMRKSERDVDDDELNDAILKLTPRQIVKTVQRAQILHLPYATASCR